MLQSHTSRELIRDFIRQAGSPVIVEQIVEHTRLKSNTVRGHLDILIATGDVSRKVADSTGRGRPHWLYFCAEPQTSPYQVLANALSIQLESAVDPAKALAAAERWAQALPALAVADTPDQAVAEATSALNELGFNAKATELGDAISVTQCPYAELVQDHPVICEIHAALLDKLLDQTGQRVTVESMEVWARKDMCVARLNRPDLNAARTISLTPQREFIAIDQVLGLEGTSS